MQEQIQPITYFSNKVEVSGRHAVSPIGPIARSTALFLVSRRSEIDRRIEQSTENWKLARLAKVDLLILRLATYELVYCPDIPHNVSLNEAIEIGKRFGTDDSAAFINGVLDQIAQVSGAKNQ